MYRQSDHTDSNTSEEMDRWKIGAHWNALKIWSLQLLIYLFYLESVNL